ncbi:MAG: DoxX family membrane protein [Candidatus Puniceispirillaceae bacterium]
MNVRNIYNNIPEFCMSHWLIRIPLIIVFLQQGLAKWPFSFEDAASMGLPAIVWLYVVLGEIGAGAGLLVGGFLPTFRGVWKEIGDLLTRFSGIVICSIMTGVIWMSEPESLSDVLLYDNFHVMLWVGGLFFALRGNRT